MSFSQRTPGRRLGILSATSATDSSMKRVALVGAVLGSLVLSGCSSPAESDPTETTAAPTSSVVVDSPMITDSQVRGFVETAVWAAVKEGDLRRTVTRVELTTLNLERGTATAIVDVSTPGTGSATLQVEMLQAESGQWQAGSMRVLSNTHEGVPTTPTTFRTSDRAQAVGEMPDYSNLPMSASHAEACKAMTDILDTTGELETGFGAGTGASDRAGAAEEFVTLMAQSEDFQNASEKEQATWVRAIRDAGAGRC